MSAMSWRTILADLLVNRRRSFLVVLAIAVGIIGAGVVLDANAILSRELGKNYMGTHPAAATLSIQNVDPALIDEIQKIQGVDAVEARRVVSGRIRVANGQWKILALFVVPDFRNIRLDTFKTDGGVWPPSDNDILIERAAMRLLSAKVGDSLVVKIPLGPERQLKLAGTVHAPGLAPAWMERCVYGFITPAALKSLGGDPNFDQLKISVKENPFDKTAIQHVVATVAQRLEKLDRKVQRVEIPEPGQHPHQTQMMTLLYLLEAFGFMALILSGVLVANMISAVLGQHVRQIGIMKAIGASRSRIMGIYFGMVLVMGCLALLLALPIAAGLSLAYVNFSATMLNFNIFDYSIPPTVIGLQILIGLGVPLLAASVPIFRGSRITVKEALSDSGLKVERVGVAGVSNKLYRPLMLSLRNTFRRRGRLVLTLATLSVGGTIFISAMNVWASMDASVLAKFNGSRYDVQVRLSRPVSGSLATRIALSVPGVVAAEGWGGASASIVGADGMGGNSFELLAPPANSAMLAAQPLIAGRWLRPGDTHALVINQRLFSAEPQMQLGRWVALRMNGKESQWQIVGVVRELMAPITAYTNLESFNAAVGLQDRVQNLVLVTQEHAPSSVQRISRAVENALHVQSVDVASTVELTEWKEAVIKHFLIIASTLIFMALLVVTVGGLGLASAMSINVLERTREIGVMRAIGAGRHAIIGIVLVEGFLIGLISWVFATILSWPISAFLSFRFGMIFFEAPLVVATSPSGIALWLAFVVVIAGIASVIPARRALDRPVRESLAYE